MTKTVSPTAVNVRLNAEDIKALEVIIKQLPRPVGLKINTSTAIKAAIHSFAEYLKNEAKKNS